MKKKASRHVRQTWKMFLATCLLGNCFSLSINASAERTFQNLSAQNRSLTYNECIEKHHNQLSNLIYNDPIQLNQALKDIQNLNFGRIRTQSPFHQLISYKRPFERFFHSAIFNTPFIFSTSAVNKPRDQKEAPLQPKALFKPVEKQLAEKRLAEKRLVNNENNFSHSVSKSMIDSRPEAASDWMTESMSESASETMSWLSNTKPASFPEQYKPIYTSPTSLPPLAPLASDPAKFTDSLPKPIVPAIEVLADVGRPFEKNDTFKPSPSSKLKVITQSAAGNAPDAVSRRTLLTPKGSERKLTSKESLSLDQTLDRLLAQTDGEDETPAILTASDNSERAGEEKRTILIRFNNISIVEYIRYLSRVTNKNFIFDENELLFNVTIVSEEPTTIDDVLVALIQVLRIHGLSLIQNGEDFIIYQNPNVRGISTVEADTMPETFRGESEIVTRVFALNTLDSSDASVVVKGLLSEAASVQPMIKTNSLVVTDFRVNVDHVNTVLRSMDSPQSGLTVGQYAVRNTDMNTLVQVAEQVMQPIAQGQTLLFVPQNTSDSIFIISTPFLLERVIPILQRLDQNSGITGVYDLKDVQFRSFNDWKKALYGGAATGQTSVKGARKPDGAQEPGRLTPEQRAGNALLQGIEGRDPREYQDLLQQQQGFEQGAGLPEGSWEIDSNGNWFYKIPNKSGQKPPLGEWSTDSNGNWIFENNPNGTAGGVPQDLLNQFNGLRTGLTRAEELQKANEEGRIIDIDKDHLPAPRGRWVRDNNGNWRFQLDPGESITSSQQTRYARLNPQLPVGFVEQTRFYIHKLQFRKGDLIQAALLNIGSSLSQSAETNSALLATINSAQWLEESNSVVIAGPPVQIEKVRELILEMDIPLRQVFIEMLILDTTVDDALNYGVNWGSKFAGGDTAGAQGFVVGGTPFTGTLGIGTQGASVSTTGSLIPPTPNASPLAGFQQGYTLGIIGRHIVHKCLGIEFNSIGALVEALHSLGSNNVILNPKIVTEDNVPAEIFVGINTRFLTQSISNDVGSIVTTNFEFRDVGTRLKVTPMLGPTNIITLEIEEEVSSLAPGGGTSTGGLANIDPGPTKQWLKAKGV